MKVAIGTDHNGVELKKHIINHLQIQKIEVIDYSIENDPLDDYPDFAIKLGQAVSNKEVDLGILICGTGIGMSIAANKVKGVRAAQVSNELEAELARNHNNANVLTFSSKNNLSDIIKIIDAFLNNNFNNEERHSRRLEKISKYETSEYNV